MTANPWDKFFWNDWENDPPLKLCSMAAQGLWMRILCICAKADPKGYLVVAGRPLSAADLAALAGKPQPEVETQLAELAAYGVFSTDRIGRIYNRRMVRDAKKARTAVENGKKGGNPNIGKQTVIPASVNPPDKPHKPEARSHRPDKKEPSLRSGEPPPPIASKRRETPEQPDLLAESDHENEIIVQSGASVVDLVSEKQIGGAFDAFNAAATKAGWPECKIRTGKRIAAVRKRIGEAGGFRGWLDAMLRASESRFLCGQNDRSWHPGGIDWFLNPTNFTKLMEGAYDDHEASGRGSAGGIVDRALAAAAYAVGSGDLGH